MRADAVISHTAKNVRLIWENRGM